MTLATASGNCDFRTPVTSGSLRVAWLRAALARSERGRAHRSAGSAADALWEGLLAGRWSIVDRFEAQGESFVVAARTERADTASRALSEREREVAELLGRGYSEKQIAFSHCLSPAVVSRSASGARTKLGLATRTELAGLFAPNGICRRMFPVTLNFERFAVGSAPVTTECLSADLSLSERIVAHAACLGSSSAAIAAERGTSRRTVENQLGGVYRKLGVHSRAELAAKLSA
jgi:DNA-binding NarL/FixJ family response regulator